MERARLRLRLRLMAWARIRVGVRIRLVAAILLQSRVRGLRVAYGQDFESVLADNHSVA